jgi:hypothetical protein
MPCPALQARHQDPAPAPPDARSGLPKRQSSGGSSRIFAISVAFVTGSGRVPSAHRGARATALSAPCRTKPAVKSCNRSAERPLREDVPVIAGWGRIVDRRLENPATRVPVISPNHPVLAKLPASST